MRQLHLDSGRTMRGGQWQVLQLLRGLRKRGAETVLLARGALLARARQEDFAAGELTWGNLLAEAPGSVLIHAHSGGAHTMAAACRLLPWVRSPLFVSRRVAFGPRRGLLSRWKYSRAACFLAVSAHVRDRLTGAGVNPTSIRVVPDGAAPLPRMPWDGRIVALDLRDRKKGGALLRRIGLPFTYISDLETELPGARLLVYLSDSEGLGSAVISAMSAGVPVVASRVGGLKELIEHEVTGLLVENGVEPVESAARRLIDDEALSQRLAAAAFERYAGRYTLERLTDDTCAAYREFSSWK
ncbi:MAG: glycosyltransferase family 4 protein [Bryobacteraceae bacterium]